jgi:hypothetical protein
MGRTCPPALKRTAVNVQGLGKFLFGYAQRFLQRVESTPRGGVKDG